MTSLDGLRIRIFADGADLDGMVRMAGDPIIEGFTTNPTLMRKAGISDYEAFARDVVKAIPDKPISFEVFSDDPSEMIDQGTTIAGWGENVNVKIPVTNTRGRFTGDVIRELSGSGVTLNVTAVFTLAQVDRVLDCLEGGGEAYVSVFAGRIADSGRDPVPAVREAVEAVAARPGTSVIWASPREVLNVFQAEEAGCHVITLANDLLKKLPLVGKDLAEFSLDTVRMFRADAVAAGYSIATPVAH